MEGPIALENRRLSIEYLGDRHSQDRLEQAYRRLELLAIATDHPTASVQGDEPEPLVTSHFSTEFQG